MATKSSIMKREIYVIANHKALMMSKYIMTFLLGLVSLYLGYKKYAPLSLYILIVLNALPPILSYFYMDYSTNNPESSLVEGLKDAPFHLQLLKEKYKYTKLNHLTNTISYSASLLLMLLWQINYNRREDLGEILSVIPTVLLIPIVFLRIFLIIIYQLKLHYDLFHNKL